MAASEKRYRTIVETANEGIWMIDSAGRTTFVNPTLAALLGFSVEELVGRPCADFVAPERREELLANLARRARGIAKTYEVLLRTRGARRLGDAPHDASVR